jgi:hypothetical protein
LLARLSNLPVDGPSVAAEAVCAGRGIDADDILPCSRLVDKSLVIDDIKLSDHRPIARDHPAIRATLLHVGADSVIADARELLPAFARERR